jgi:hypothetical protein
MLPTEPRPLKDFVDAAKFGAGIEALPMGVPDSPWRRRQPLRRGETVRLKFCPV